MPPYEVLIVTQAAEMQQALDVRRRVFIEEQSVPKALEIDEHDGDPATVTTALHVLVRVEGQPVATGRLLLDTSHDGAAHIGRVAVLAEARRGGYGRAVMQALHTLARERGLNRVTLAAQLHAIPFYESLGYRLRPGDVFLDAGIEHRWMEITLN